jgi:N-carbamoyl-L-amino-acid hydrolase
LTRTYLKIAEVAWNHRHAEKPFGPQKSQNGYFLAFDLSSGAGHDAQDMAHVAPMAMIFVPSQDGISHAPREYTAPADIANGVDVLLRTLLAIDRGLPGP